MSVRLFEQMILQYFFLNKNSNQILHSRQSHFTSRHAHTEYLVDMSDGKPDQGK